MRIALSGVHGSGKTTVYNELKQYLTTLNFIDSPSRAIGAITGINENGSEYGQDLILTETIKRCFHLSSLHDRCVLDTLCYTTQLYAHGKVSTQFFDYNYTATKELLPFYDHIFYIEPEFNLVDDGTRSQSIAYRDEIWQYFKLYIKEFNIPVIQLTGSVEERVAQVLSALGKVQ